MAEKKSAGKSSKPKGNPPPKKPAVRELSEEDLDRVSGGTSLATEQSDSSHKTNLKNSIKI